MFAHSPVAFLRSHATACPLISDGSAAISSIASEATLSSTAKDSRANFLFSRLRELSVILDFRSP